MTRINCVPVEELTDKHLVAEYRELPRVFGLVDAAHARGESPYDERNPKEYTLGAGHVRFFYPRLWYLHDRFGQLVVEMQKRGFKPKHTKIPECTAPSSFWQNWEPTEEALKINRDRIQDRLTLSALLKEWKK